MKITTLNDRIAKAQETIAKKENTITKKMALIEKKKAQLTKKGINPETADACEHRDDSEAFWTICEIEHLYEDIERGKSEIEEKKKALESYKAQLAGEIEKESIFIKELPENVLQMRDELVERWDEYDKNKRDFLCNEYARLGYREFSQKYRHAGHEFRKLTDSQIHDANVRDAKNLILNLYNRVKEITGEITSWKGIYLTQGAHFSAVLNGYVEGKQGRASVESILAGGYNIQRLHVRVLVKEYI